MKHLRWALPDEGGTARARGFPVGALLDPLGSGQTVDMKIEQPQAVVAVAPLIPRLYILAASATNVIAPSFWMINIAPVTAYPAFVNLDFVMTVIHHIPGSAFVTDHLIPLLLHSTRSYNHAQRS
jgi:hypothetical protein